MYILVSCPYIMDVSCPHRNSSLIYFPNLFYDPRKQCQQSVFSDEYFVYCLHFIFRHLQQSSIYSAPINVSL